MLDYTALDPAKKAFVFELDDVLFPQQDYILQVYYLFANFLEYTETAPPAKDLVEFLKKAYLAHGEEGIFDRAAAVFGIDEKYRENFNRLHATAQLPLKLLLYPESLELLKAILTDGKFIFILTKGNPLMQLNKLKHIDWHGLDKKLKVYFYDEIALLNTVLPIDFIIKENKLNAQEVLLIGKDNEEEIDAIKSNIAYQRIL